MFTPHLGSAVDGVRRETSLQAARQVRQVLAGSSRAAETLQGAGLRGATAVVCAQEEDLHTLETALLTRKLREDVRVVVQLGNPAVGRALAQISVSVLDVAGLSAPSIAEACLGPEAQEIRLSGERFAVARTTAPHAASLRDLYGALAPVAVVPAGGGDVVVCPGRDHQVRAGDVVTLIGTPAELRTAGVASLSKQPHGLLHRPGHGAGGRYAGAARGSAGRARWHPVSEFRQFAVSLLHAADRRLATALAALFVVLAASTAVLRLTYHLRGTRPISVLDAAYFTVETVTTVGYGDFSFRGQSPVLMPAAICLMLAGALFVAVFFAVLRRDRPSPRSQQAVARPVRPPQR